MIGTKGMRQGQVSTRARSRRTSRSGYFWVNWAEGSVCSGGAAEGPGGLSIEARAAHLVDGDQDRRIVAVGADLLEKDTNYVRREPILAFGQLKQLQETGTIG